MFRQPFVEGWDFVSILGEGTFGQVKLAMNTQSKELVAVKIIEINISTDIKAMQREICIHKMLKHERIVQCYGYRKESEQCYIFMEYICNGELYNLIDPGQPLNESDAFRFFYQLLDGLEYMHSLGVVHRDIKLENLLIDNQNNIKITDFGFSTLFRDKDKERLLDRVCGSVPYLAPEVLSRKRHHAEPIDLWSTGIVLYILFQGEFPWDRADYSCKEFICWVNGKLPHESWNKLTSSQLDIIRLLLNVNPEQRATISVARDTTWFHQHQVKQNANRLDFERKLHRRTTPKGLSLSQQPAEVAVFVKNFEEFNLAPNAHKNDEAFFSQPINMEDNILVSQCSPCFDNPIQMSELSKAVKRLTRFIVCDVDFVQIMTRLCASLECAGCSWQMMTQKLISVRATDTRREELKFKIYIFCSPNKKILVDFKLASGDGLEFKKVFKVVREKVCEFIPFFI